MTKTLLQVFLLSMILIKVAVGDEKSSTAAYLMVDHYAPTYENTDPYSTTGLYGMYTMDKENTLAFYQIMIKKYLVEENEDEVQLDDFRAYWFHTISKDVGVRFSGTAALSNGSQRRDKFGSAGIRLSFNSKFVNDKIDFRIRPLATYYLNEYKQTVDGNLLTQYRIGGQLYGKYIFSDKFQFVTILGMTLDYYERGVNNDNEDMEGRGSMSVDSYFSYSFSKQLGARLGYTYADSQIVDGRYEMYAFRPDGGAAINFGLDYTF